MGELGNKRNNQLAENGLLFDADGNVFDLTQWYKENGLAVSSMSLNQEILSELKIITAHLAEMSGETITKKDIENDSQ